MVEQAGTDVVTEPQVRYDRRLVARNSLAELERDVVDLIENESFEIDTAAASDTLADSIMRRVNRTGPVGVFVRRDIRMKAPDSTKDMQMRRLRTIPERLRDLANEFDKLMKLMDEAQNTRPVLDVASVADGVD